MATTAGSSLERLMKLIYEPSTSGLTENQIIEELEKCQEHDETTKMNLLDITFTSCNLSIGRNVRAKRVDMAKLQGEIDRAEELILQNMDGMLKVRLGQVELVNHQDLIARLMRQRLNLDRTSDEMERRQGQQ